MPAFPSTTAIVLWTLFMLISVVWTNHTEEKIKKQERR
jgi:hypothetical protein